MEQMEELDARFQEAFQYKGRWLALYQQLYQYVIPNRDAFNEKFNYNDNGKPLVDSIWDDTAVIASYQRANDLHGILLPKDRVWGKLKMDPHDFSVEDIKANKPELDEINDNIFYYINQSNLSRVVAASNLDLVGGTGALWIESHTDHEPLYFRSVPAVCVYVEYSTDDTIEDVWYQCKMSGRKILKTFNYNGKHKDKLEKNPNELFSVIYGQIKLSPTKYYIYAILQEDPLHPMWEKERGYKQIIVYRDRVRPGEAEGRGIALDMLPTIRDLNKLQMQHRKSFGFKALPPMFYDSNSYFNPKSMAQWSGVMIPRDPSMRLPLEAFQMPASPEVEPEIIRMQETIRKAFMVDPLGEIDSPVKSATEMSIREARSQRTSSTDISRLINELPAEVFVTSAKILNERNLLTRDKRESRINVGSKKVRFDYSSPLYDLQKQANLKNFINKGQVVQQLYGEGAVLAITNVEETDAFLTEMLNLPSKLYKSGEEIQKLMETMGEQAATAELPTPSTAAVPGLQAPPGVAI